MNTYLLTYDPLGLTISSRQLQAFIKDNRNVFQWYSPFYGTYVLKSHSSLYELQESLRGILVDCLFFLAPLYPSNVGGTQQSTIWTWINGGEFPALPNN